MPKPAEEFKFPIFHFSAYYHHREKLNPLEKQLYDAQAVLLAGNYEKSYAMTKRVWAQAKDGPKYLQLGILYQLCMEGIYCLDTERVTGYFAEIQGLLQQDFPYKREMEAFALARKNDCPLMLVALLQALGTVAAKELKKFDKKLYDRAIVLWGQQTKGALLLNKRLKKTSVYEQYTEDEILLLMAVAAGHTNAELAAMYHLKGNSISKKLSALYTKCGISSRQQVKDFVLEHFV